MSVYVLGVSCTKFGKYPETSFKNLTRQAFVPVLEDAGLADGMDVDSIYFSNVKMEMFGQPSIRGQVCLDGMVKEGRLAPRAPVINVEGACATGSVALHCAWKDVLSGQSDLSLAIGVEKTFIPNDAERQYELFAGAQDRFDPARPVEEILPLDGRDDGEVGDGPRHAFGVVRGRRKPGFRVDLERRHDIREEPGEAGDQQLEAGDPEHGRERPDLGDAERGLILITVDELHGAGERDLQMGCAEQGVGKRMDARSSTRFAPREAGQPVVEAGRQVFPELEDRGLDMVVVVEQPFRRRAALRPRSARGDPRPFQPCASLREPGPCRQCGRFRFQPVEAMTRGDFMRFGRERFRAFIRHVSGGAGHGETHAVVRHRGRFGMG